MLYKSDQYNIYLRVLSNVSSLFRVIISFDLDSFVLQRWKLLDVATEVLDVAEWTHTSNKGSAI